MEWQNEYGVNETSIFTGRKDIELERWNSTDF